MKTYLFNRLLTSQGWKSKAEVKVDHRGLIISIDYDSQSKAAEYVNGYALPGFQNAHSHSFQYAMSGIAESHEGVGVPDDFWSWREAMYKLALTVNPDQFETIATMLYVEMLQYGYTNVAEFHYLHHDKNGKQFNNIAEMGSRLVAAAKNAGIKLTLIPIFYQKGGFNKNPTKAQRRFISKTIDAYQRLYDASERVTKNYKDANIAIGIHSMRGVEPELIKKVASQFSKEVPFHIHISEQQKEVQDAINYLGQRPVEWMLDNVDMSERYHLVHATHLTEAETIGIAKTGANVVLCPSTEGNLGDGIFPLELYQRSKGQWSIGTDSHVGLNPLEELRILDYGQRLTTHKRNSFYLPKFGDSGLFGIDMALKAGRKAMNNFNTDYFKVGEPFDAIVYDANSPLLACTSIEHLSSTIVYSSNYKMHLGTMVNGKWVVYQGNHMHEDTIKSNFIKTINALKSR